MKKSTLILFISTAIFFTSTLYLLFLNLQKPKDIVVQTQTPTVIPTRAIDSTTDWKTYENKEYGFEFKYPQKYKQVISNTSICITETEPDKDYGGCDIYVLPQKLTTSVEKNIQSSLGLPTDISLKEFANQSKWNYQEKTIDNLNWIIFHQNEGPGEGTHHNYVSSKNVIVDLGVSSELSKSDELFQILSTFKFSESKISSYQELLDKFNQKFGVNLKYEDEVVAGDIIKTLDLSDYFNPEFSKNGKTFGLDSIKQVLIDFGLVYNPSLDKSEITSWQNSYQSANLNCDLSGNEEFLHLKCYLPR